MQSHDINLKIRKLTKAQFDTITPEIGELDFVVDEEYGGNSSSRNIGEVVQSTLPLVDAGLHLLDGSLIRGNGVYSDFVRYDNAEKTGKHTQQALVIQILKTSFDEGHFQRKYHQDFRHMHKAQARNVQEYSSYYFPVPLKSYHAQSSLAVVCFQPIHF